MLNIQENETSVKVPMPFLRVILQQESDLIHFHVPKGNDEDSYIIIGLDHGDTNIEYRITSRGYGTGQYTLYQFSIEILHKIHET